MGASGSPASTGGIAILSGPGKNAVRHSLQICANKSCASKFYANVFTDPTRFASKAAIAASCFRM